MASRGSIATRRNNNEIAVTEEPEKPRASLRDLLGRSANDF